MCRCLSPPLEFISVAYTNASKEGTYEAVMSIMPQGRPSCGTDFSHSLPLWHGKNELAWGLGGGEQSHKRQLGHETPLGRAEWGADHLDQTPRRNFTHKQHNCTLLDLT